MVNWYRKNIKEGLNDIFKNRHYLIKSKPGSPASVVYHGTYREVKKLYEQNWYDGRDVSNWKIISHKKFVSMLKNNELSPYDTVQYERWLEFDIVVPESKLFKDKNQLNEESEMFYLIYTDLRFKGFKVKRRGSLSQVEETMEKYELNGAKIVDQEEFISMLRRNEVSKFDQKTYQYLLKDNKPRRNRVFKRPMIENVEIENNDPYFVIYTDSNFRGKIVAGSGNMEQCEYTKQRIKDRSRFPGLNHRFASPNIITREEFIEMIKDDSIYIDDAYQYVERMGLNKKEPIKRKPENNDPYFVIYNDLRFDEYVIGGSGDMEYCEDIIQKLKDAHQEGHVKLTSNPEIIAREKFIQMIKGNKIQRGYAGDYKERLGLNENVSELTSGPDKIFNHMQKIAEEETYKVLERRYGNDNSNHRQLSDAIHIVIPFSEENTLYYYFQENNIGIENATRSRSVNYYDIIPNDSAYNKTMYHDDVEIQFEVIKACCKYLLSKGVQVNYSVNPAAEELYTNLTKTNESVEPVTRDSEGFYQVPPGASHKYLEQIKNEKTGKAAAITSIEHNGVQFYMVNFIDSRGNTVESLYYRSFDLTYESAESWIASEKKFKAWEWDDAPFGGNKIQQVNEDIAEIDERKYQDIMQEITDATSEIIGIDNPDLVETGPWKLCIEDNQENKEILDYFNSIDFGTQTEGVYCIFLNQILDRVFNQKFDILNKTYIHLEKEILVNVSEILDGFHIKSTVTEDN